MFSAGFETAISVINRLQTNASDRMATVVGFSFAKYLGYTFILKNLPVYTLLQISKVYYQLMYKRITL